MRIQALPVPLRALVGRSGARRTRVGTREARRVTSSLGVLVWVLLSACGGAGGAGPAGNPPPVDPGPVTPPDVPLDIAVEGLLARTGPEPGSVVLDFVAPGGAGEGPAEAYVVRAGVRHLSDDTLSEAQTIAVAAAPKAPGQPESITVRGLEPGRTLQLAVQARRAGVLTPLGIGVAARVAGDDLPAPPAGSLAISGPATLAQDGATYLLTKDVSTPGTAFWVTGAGVTLDLGGHTVTYGTGGAPDAVGVYAEYPSRGAPTVVRHGRLVQGGSGARGHGVHMRGTDGVRISYLDVTVSGPDAMGVWLVEPGDARVDHTTVRCQTTVVSDRHYPGVAAIFVEQADDSVEVDEDAVLSSPQWGINVEGRQTNGRVLIHHDRVQGTKALVVNGYMLAVHKPRADVYENVLHGESRGIHIDGIDAKGNDAWIHDNSVDFQDQTNAEYPDKHWAHGIKMEGASSVTIERNRVRGVADPAHAEVYALDLSIGSATGLLVRHNRFEAISTTPSLLSRALSWSWGSSVAPADVTIEENVFTATDVLVFHDWDGGGAGRHLRNWWTRDTSQGAGHAFVFEHFLTGDTSATHGTRFEDPLGDADPLGVSQWASPGPYDSTREATLALLVRKGAVPVAGASVTVHDRAGQVVLQGTTGTDGRFAGDVLVEAVTRGPAFDARGPFRVDVAKAGVGAWGATVAMDGPTAWVVDLATASATADGTAPAAPDAVVASPLSASRVYLRWTPAADDTGVLAYVVLLDDRVVGVTDAPAFVVAGLDPSTTYRPSVRAVDLAGHLGPSGAGALVTTRVEDRGP